MAGISVNAPQGNPVETLATSTLRDARDAKEKNHPARTQAASEGQDTVTLSAAARPSQTASAGDSTLNDSDAQSQSANLRRLLDGQSLSGTAKQNQAILSLLR